MVQVRRRHETQQRGHRHLNVLTMSLPITHEVAGWRCCGAVIQREPPAMNGKRSYARCSKPSLERNLFILAITLSREHHGSAVIYFSGKAHLEMVRLRLLSDDPTSNLLSNSSTRHRRKTRPSKRQKMGASAIAIERPARLAGASDELKPPPVENRTACKSVIK
jgi:hypothetical protein